MTDDSASLRALAAQYVVSPTTIAKMVRKAQQEFEEQQPKMIMGRDGKRRPDRRTNTEARDTKIIALRDAGWTMRDIAATAQCSVGTVHRVIKLLPRERTYVLGVLGHHVGDTPARSLTRRGPPSAVEMFMSSLLGGLHAPR